MNLIHFYRTPILSESGENALLASVQSSVSKGIRDIKTEHCFNIAVEESLSPDEIKVLTWLLTETFDPGNFSDKSFLTDCKVPFNSPLTKGGHRGVIIEVGPRMNFSTAWSTNAVSICHACGLKKISRIERSRRYQLDTDTPLNNEENDLFIKKVHDRMTECQYPEQLSTFETGMKPEPVVEIPLIKEGKEALEKINREMGLGLDDWDVDYYYNLFVNDIGRNPTNVECFDLSQSNSEHSRHWFFKGKLIVDGKEAPHDLIELIKKPLDLNPNNSIIAFNDNSSSIRGYSIETIVPEYPGTIFQIYNINFPIRSNLYCRNS